MTVYVTQSRVCRKYQMAAADTKLVTPFLEEAQKPWSWSPFYRAVAQPILGTDPVMTDRNQGSLADSDDLVDADPCEKVSSSYDVDTALAMIKRGHAWEVQSFVIAHENACLTKLIEEIDLEHQLRLLENGVTAWVADHDSYCDSDSGKQLVNLAKVFAESVHREEMLKAEIKIKKAKVPFDMFTMVLRITCAVSLMLALMFMSHELLTRLFAIFFAIGCGMALLWEDLVWSCVQALFGATFRRLDSLFAQLLRLTASVWEA
jgi:hypothetical protein